MVSFRQLSLRTNAVFLCCLAVVGLTPSTSYSYSSSTIQQLEHLLRLSRNQVENLVKKFLTTVISEVKQETDEFFSMLDKWRRPTQNMVTHKHHQKKSTHSIRKQNPKKHVFSPDILGPTTTNNKTLDEFTNDALSGKNFSEDRFNEIWWLTKHNISFGRKQHTRLLHALAAASKKTRFGKECMRRDLQKYGNIPASKKVTDMVHSALKAADCPVVDVPVYQLKKGSIDAVGLAGVQAIWIDEEGRDLISIEHTCVHEAGHWYYQHSCRGWIIGQECGEQDEYEADEFSLKYVCESHRHTTIARAQHVIKPVDYFNNKALMKILKPTIIKQSYYETITQLSTPSPEHARYIINIAREQYPELL